MTKRSALALVVMFSVATAGPATAQTPKLDTARIEAITGLEGTFLEQEGVFTTGGEAVRPSSREA